MIVGFTGTQRGLTSKQSAELRILLRELDSIELHHGDCIGADEQAHAIAKGEFYSIVIHPPESEKKRAFCIPGDNDALLPPKPYLERNQAIVHACDLLIACPRTPHEELRSGTWATIRYARRVGRLVRILEP